MSEWWSYTLSDFLLFSPRVYYRLLELHNRELWPAHLVAWAAGFAMLWSMMRLRPGSSRVALVLLGAAWLWIAWAFIGERYATINWAAAYVAPAMALQGLLSIGVAGLGRGTMADRRGAPLFALVLMGYPLLSPVLGRGWLAAESFAMMPDPTAVGALAFAAALHTRWRWALMIVPAAWCAVTGATLAAMGAQDYLIAPLAAVVALALGVRRRSPAASPPPVT